jgi:CBS domain-containing protein
MTKARELMHSGATCIGENGTLSRAAEMMRDLHVGALPICGEDGRLHGVLTDRDIVVRAIAEGYEPDTATAADLAQGTPVWVDADANTDEVIEIMVEAGIRRIPVLEEQRLVGMISEADLASSLSDQELKRFSEALYTARPNT